MLAYLGRILPPKMAEYSLRAMRFLLPEIDLGQGLPSMLPLVPLILVVNVLCNWVELGLAASVECLRLKCHRGNKLFQ